MTDSAASSSGGQGGHEQENRTSPQRWALRSPMAVVVFVSLVLGGLAADLASKHWVFQSLLSDPALIARAEQVRACHVEPDTKAVLHEFRRNVGWGVSFTLSANPGVVFGWPLPPWAVVIATIVTVVLVCLFFATSDRGAWAVHLSLAFILAGALGNLYDRLFSEIAPLSMEPIRRNVRDFIDCSDLYYPWVFNVADVLLVVGVVVLALNAIVAEVARMRAKS